VRKRGSGKGGEGVGVDRGEGGDSPQKGEGGGAVLQPSRTPLHTSFFLSCGTALLWYSPLVAPVDRTSGATRGLYHKRAAPQEGYATRGCTASGLCHNRAALNDFVPTHPHNTHRQWFGGPAPPPQLPNPRHQPSVLPDMPFLLPGLILHPPPPHFLSPLAPPPTHTPITPSVVWRSSFPHSPGVSPCSLRRPPCCPA